MRKLLRWSWLVVLGAFLYAGLTIYLRRSQNREIEQAAEQRRADADRKVLEGVGGGDLKILVLYASPPVVSSGAKTLLCYGVAAAKEVTFEPAVDGAGPSLSRCLEIHPRRTTKYTMTVRDAAGHSATRDVEVQVR